VYYPLLLSSIYCQDKHHQRDVHSSQEPLCQNWHNTCSRSGR